MVWDGNRIGTNCSKVLCRHNVHELDRDTHGTVAIDSQPLMVTHTGSKTVVDLVAAAMALNLVFPQALQSQAQGQRLPPCTSNCRRIA